MEFKWEALVHSVVRRVLKWYPLAIAYKEDLLQEGRLTAWQVDSVPVVGIPQHWFVWRKVHGHLREQARNLVNTVHQPQRERKWVNYAPVEALISTAAPALIPEAGRSEKLTKALDSIARRLPEHHSSSIASRTISVEMYYRHQQGETLLELSGDFGISQQAVRKRLLSVAKTLEPVAA